MTDQESLAITLKVIKRCTTFDQLKILSSLHSGHIEIQQAINERACQILDAGQKVVRNTCFYTGKEYLSLSPAE